MDNEELQTRIDNLERDIQQLKRDAEERSAGVGRESQLKFPLDTRSKRIIEDITIYPITVRLKSTDAATGANYGVFFTSERQYSILAATEIHGTKGTDGSAVTLQLERLQGTEAPDAGDALLSTTFNLKGNINTVQYGQFVTSGVTALERGDRLCLKDAGILTAVADLCVTVYLQAA